jgi:hypothetical protein
MSTSNWLIGSVRLATAATIVCNGVDVVIPAGTYYLRDATGSLSLIGLIAAGLAGVVPGTTCYIGRDRKLRIVSGGVALTLTIPSALQAVLGLAGAPTPGTTITAALISTLLWSPSRRGTPAGVPLGITGRVIDDVVQTVGPDGAKIRTTFHNSMTVIAWSWLAVPQARVWTTDAGLGGEFKAFDTAVIRYGLRFKFYDQVDEDSASSTAVTWPTALGPYVANVGKQDWFARMVSVLDVWANLDLAATLTAEIT